MSTIAFIDLEVEPKSRRILDIGSVKGDGSYFHKTSIPEFILFLKGTQFICGHNIFKHDIKYIGNALNDAGVNSANIIDTLFLSPLLFPTKPYHALLKDDKLQSEEMNNPFELSPLINAGSWNVIDFPPPVGKTARIDLFSTAALTALSCRGSPP